MSHEEEDLVFDGCQFTGCSTQSATASAGASTQSATAKAGASLEKFKATLIKARKREASRRYEQRHPNRRKAASVRWNRTLESRYRMAQHGAKRRGLAFELSFDEFCQVAKQPCFYCANQIGAPCQVGGGLDRLNNNLGYYADNVVSCCRVCNSTKNRYFSTEETIIMIEALIEYREKMKGIGQ